MNQNNIITSDDILGKAAVDPEGSILGVVSKVHVEKSDMKIVGITIDMGVMRPDLFIGANFIKEFGKDAILLSRVPIDKFKGLKVMSHQGELIGTVKSLVEEKGKVKEFVVSGKGIFGGKYSMTYKDIEQIGERIVLKKDRKLNKAKEKIK